MDLEFFLNSGLTKDRMMYEGIVCCYHVCAHRNKAARCYCVLKATGRTEYAV